MPFTPIESFARPTPIVLTPPAGGRAIYSAATDARRRSKGIRLRDLIRAEPTPVHLMLAAVVYWAVPWAIAKLQGIALPHDGLFSAVVYLMWSGSPAASERMTPLFNAATSLHLMAAAFLAASALLPRERMFAPIHRVADRFYKYAIALPLWTLLAANLARFVADQVYSFAGIVRWDFTPWIARVEAPLIASFQHAFASTAMSVFASNFYSAIWLTPIAFAGFALVAADKPRALNSLIVAYVLTSLCAVPLFVLLPTFDPWTTNALYGGFGHSTGIRYLYTNPSVPTLTRINREFHWATGSAFPSLHAAFPLVVSLVLRKHGLRVASRIMAGMAAITAFVIVYLGRHWIIDAIAAVPFAYAVLALEAHLPLNVVIGPKRKQRATLRPGEIPVPTDARVDAAHWLSGVFFVSGFAALLYQIVWQRTLFGIIGLNIESVTLVVTAFMLGLGVGSLAGGVLSNRAEERLPLFFAAAEIGIGVFGFFSLAVFHAVGQATLAMSPALTALTTFATLLPPTILMGATLPLLVKNHVRVQRSVGDAVGRLYFTNTLGSAAAAAFAALVLLGPLGQQATVQVAAVLNVGAGVLVYVRSRRAATIR